MSDYAMYIPYVNRPDLLDKAFNSAWDLRANLSIIDNSKDGLDRPFPGIFVMRPPVPLTFSQTMNWMLADSRRHGASICMWMHSDAEAAEGSALALLGAARVALDAGVKWGVLFTNYDAMSAINLKAVEEVGEFDTNLPQYFSDNDYYRRMKLAGWDCMETGIDVHHEASQTIKSDPEREFLNGKTFPLYERYYVSRWGGAPGHEVFKTPFGR